MSRIAIVAALEREVKPLIKNWPSTEKEHAGRRFRFFEHNDIAVVCGGIGSAAARRAAEAAIVLYSPAVVYSAGFAGALKPEAKVGTVLFPRRVIDATDSSSVDTGAGDQILVTCNSVVGPEQKAKLAAAYHAIAVDMEAAAVARAAQARGVRFAALKSISDEGDFPMPPMERFISPGGTFRQASFTFYALLRPWLWHALIRLARDTRLAANALCNQLRQLDQLPTAELSFSGGTSTQ